MNLWEDAREIIQEALQSALPDEAVKSALKSASFGRGRPILVAVGKAAWQMAEAAYGILGNRIDEGVVVTKYDHGKGAIGNLRIYEAGHPVPDENSFQAACAVLETVKELEREDTVLFLLSGGGSALFEKPLIDKEELSDLTKQLMASGADIVEMNTIRKRVSGVKGGRFAQICAPAKVFSIVLSDIIGSPLDMIASGPAYPDSTTSKQALSIIEKYHIQISDKAREVLLRETPKELTNVETHVTGSVSLLCQAAAKACKRLGYETTILTDCLSCQAKEAGVFLSNIARYYKDASKSLAFVAGGETVVQLVGKGLGGRNQELALAAAPGIAGLDGIAVFSIGSDGTDGPTDAAGGYVDGNTQKLLEDKGIDIYDVLMNNDAYHALEQSDGLIITGPTGTNVNDVAVLLIRK